MKGRSQMCEMKISTNCETNIFVNVEYLVVKLDFLLECKEYHFTPCHKNMGCGIKINMSSPLYPLTNIAFFDQELVLAPRYIHVHIKY